MPSSTRKSAARLVLTALIAGTLILFNGTAAAKIRNNASFDGVWRGAGTISYRGWEEPISCRVQNTNKSDAEFYSHFRCTLKRFGSGSLTILMERVGTSRYSGGFYDGLNKSNVRVSVVQKGRQQRVQLSGRKWSGVLHLRK
ncbi:MAG: hypothetical protein KJ558_05120 [Gammaproteobacteria bacterium]|nr:hypothetical protein [Gammaproteobacteria bacterium]MBU1654197.1 hypothetical protein [Gammaproteobacteria bacterium]MBU1960857.1 hypothetical protein [Gammaproteobacteria bacterium]